MPTNIHDVRGFFTSTSSSKSVAVDSSQQPGDTSNESDLLSEDEALIFEGLRRDGWILLQEEGRAKRESSKLDRRRKACRATLKIPGTDIEFEARAGAPQTVSLVFFAYPERCVLNSRIPVASPKHGHSAPGVGIEGGWRLERPHPKASRIIEQKASGRGTAEFETSRLGSSRRVPRASNSVLSPIKKQLVG